MKSLSPLLIANRGEIAERIVRTAKRLGIETIVVYSDADGETLAVKNADRAVRLGPAPVSESYLNGEKILAIAHEQGARSVHPGYGLLSENSSFARDVEAAGLIWVGPSPDSMACVASKSKAKDIAQQAHVPTVPGYRGPNSVEAFLQAAQDISYPVLLKAAAGGGGRGIRRVNNANELPAQLELARREAASAFGNEEILLEKLIPEAHHIEVQIFGDSAGQIVHLGERDCSAQRRHQKVIEESPSPIFAKTGGSVLRNQICEAAVKFAQAAKYTNAGTVEFLVTAAGKFYFLEMNTRLQVEHPVTEMVTGLDLVEWQLRIAAGEKLPRAQSEIKAPQGHAIQLRLYAEDPYDHYRPQTGRPEAVVFPDSNQKKEIRVDHFLTPRTTITPFYDAMLAKIIVHAPDRSAALALAHEALDQTLIAGLTTNREFLGDILSRDFFVKGQTFTHQLDDLKIERPIITSAQRSLAFAVATILFYKTNRSVTAGATSLINKSAWSNGLGRQSVIALADQDHRVRLHVTPEANGFRLISSAGVDASSFAPIELKSVAISSQRIQFSVGSRKFSLPFACDDESAHFVLDGHTFSIRNRLAASGATKKSTANSDAITAPMDGTLVKISAAPSDKIAKGQVLAIVEAMKMQLELRSPRMGVIKSVLAKAGQQVRRKQVLFELEPLEQETRP